MSLFKVAITSNTDISEKRCVRVGRLVSKTDTSVGQLVSKTDTCIGQSVSKTGTDTCDYV